MAAPRPRVSVEGAASLKIPLGSGRMIPEDFVPKMLVCAILLKRGERLTTDSLFSLVQVMLRQAVSYLDGRAQVEVIPIERA